MPARRFPSFQGKIGEMTMLSSRFLRLAHASGSAAHDSPAILMRSRHASGAALRNRAVELMFAVTEEGAIGLRDTAGAPSAMAAAAASRSSCGTNGASRQSTSTGLPGRPVSGRASARAGRGRRAVVLGFRERVRTLVAS